MHHRAKLTDVQVADIRAKRQQKPWLWSYAALADYAGSKPSTVRDIVKRRTRAGAQGV